MPLDAKRVLKPFKKVGSALKRWPRNADPRQVHKFRTNLRRIEAALDALGMDSDGLGREVLRREKRFRQRAGKVRDRDVLTSLGSSPSLNANSEARLEVVEFLGAERYRHAEKLRSLTRRDGAKLRNSLKHCRREIQRQLEPAPDRNGLRASAAGASRAVEICSELMHFPKLTRSNLHEFRLEVKHLRNILQMATNADRPFVDALGEVKDKIGEWHDWEELTVTARDVVQERSAEFLAELKKITEAKYRQAMRAAQHLRSRYFSEPQSRKQSLSMPAASAPARVASTLIAA